MRVTAFYLKSVTKRSGSSSSARERERKRKIEKGDKKDQSITKIFIILNNKKTCLWNASKHREIQEKYSRAMWSHRNSKRDKFF